MSFLKKGLTALRKSGFGGHFSTREIKIQGKTIRIPKLDNLKGFLKQALIKFKPQIQHIFDPSKFSNTYNPWNPAMWENDFKKPENTENPNEGFDEHQKPPKKHDQPQPPQQPAPQQPAQQPAQQPSQQPAQEEEPQLDSQTDHDLQEAADQLFKFENVEEFQKLRHHTTVESALTQLRELATELNQVDSKQFLPAPASCFITCNSYTKPSYQLGVGPINDAITVAANHRVMGYKVYFLHNPTPVQYLKFLKVFLKLTEKYLSVYYTGHGSQVKDTNGDEEDGYDEVIVFDTGYIVDDELVSYISKYFNQKAHTILMNDCCHSGTVWDIPEDLEKAQQLPPNILALSAALDSQTAKQTTIDANDQGVFTYNFWTLVRNNPTITAPVAQNILNRTLKRFSQQFVACATRKEMLEKPIFPLLGQ